MKVRSLLLEKFREWIVPERKPDQIIGGHEDPYMLRWFIVPRNPLLNIYLHQFRRSDDDRALHDHPWWSLSLMLSGELGERYITPFWRPLCDAHPELLAYPHNVMEESRVLRAGQWVFRRGKFAHRLIVRNEFGAWTLFITGPRYRQWGFLCPRGWRHWKKFVDPNNPGVAGPGCD